VKHYYIYILIYVKHGNSTLFYFLGNHPNNILGDINIIPGCGWLHGNYYAMVVLWYTHTVGYNPTYRVNRLYVNYYNTTRNSLNVWTGEGGKYLNFGLTNLSCRINAGSTLLRHGSITGGVRSSCGMCSATLANIGSMKIHAAKTRQQWRVT